MKKPGREEPTSRTLAKVREVDAVLQEDRHATVHHPMTCFGNEENATDGGNSTKGDMFLPKIQVTVPFPVMYL